MDTPTAPDLAPPGPALSETTLKVYDRILATVSALGLILGGVWGIYTYAQARQKENEQKAAEVARVAELRAKEIELRKQELALQVFKERKETYYALCDAACKIVACRDRKEVEARSRPFLEMYYGRAHIVAEGDPEVSEKKVAFKEKLLEYLEGESKSSTVAPHHVFGNLAYALTKACRKHIDPRSLSPHAE